MDVHVLRTVKAESEVQRGKPKCTLQSENRGFVVRTTSCPLQQNRGFRLKKELELAGEGELKVGGVGSGEGKELVP